MSGYIWSEHALIRMNERFPNRDIRPFIERARIATKSIRKKIRENCPLSWEKFHAGGFKNRYILYNARNNIVYVVKDGNIVVTVFRLEGK